MLHKMSLGYLVLIIHDLYCKCAEHVFVKVMAASASDVEAVESFRRCENTSAFSMETLRRLPDVS